MTPDRNRISEGQPWSLRGGRTVGTPLRQWLLLGGCVLGDAALSFLGSAPRSAALAVAPSLTLRRGSAVSSVSGGGGQGIGMIEIVQELEVFG